MSAPSHRLHWHEWLLLALLATASLSTKSLGAAWALFVWVGCWRGWTLRQRPDCARNPGHSPELRWWLVVCAVAFMAKALATAYWQDPWDERHGEIRLLLAAMAAHGACGLWSTSALTRLRLTAWISHALSLTALLGLAWVIWKGRASVTTHPIPWAGVMAFFCCWLLAVSTDAAHALPQRRLWLAGSALAAMAVLASQSRGAYAVVPWFLGVCAWQGWCAVVKSPHKPQARRRLAGSALAAALLLAALVWTPVFERARSAIENALSEARVSQQDPQAGANSSVGARLYMWQRSLPVIVEAPWLGHGVSQRRAMIRQWGEEAQSGEVRSLSHLHNEYLNQLVEHGLLGLTSQLCYVLGLALLALQLRRSGQSTAALALGGLWLAYAVGNVTSVNFGHNYYTAGLSLMIGLILSLLSKPRGGQIPPAPS